MTPPTLNIALVNNTGSSDAYAYVTGLEINNNNKPILIQSDGQTVYRPDSPSDILQKLAVDCGIKLGAPGSTTTVTIPQIAGGRIWFSRDSPLQFFINPGPALVEPSVTNQSDANYNQFWAFCEFTYNQFELFVNISYVDFVSMPIALSLQSSTGNSQTVQGLPPNGLDTIASKLVEQDNQDHAGWSQLIVKSPSGGNLRVLSPNAAITMNNSLFNSYYQPYVDQVWDKYTNETLTINTQAQWGNNAGKVVNGVLTFDNIGTFEKPSTVDIFSNSTGPFASQPTNTQQMGAITARLAAAFNRSTLLVNNNQPDGEDPSTYYKNGITNHFSRICHETSPDGRGYAFPYDDVVPSGGQDQSGSASSGDPVLLTVTVGGGGGYGTAEAQTTEGSAQKPIAETKKATNGNSEKAATNGSRTGVSNGTKQTGEVKNKRLSMANLKRLPSLLKKKLAA